MDIELRFFATFREAVGRKEIERSFPDDATVGDVLAALEAEFEGLEGELLDDDGDVRPRLSIMKNGRNVIHLEGTATPLSADDEVSVFPPVAGGEMGGEDGWRSVDGTEGSAGWDRSRDRGRHARSRDSSDRGDNRADHDRGRDDTDGDDTRTDHDRDRNPDRYRTDGGDRDPGDADPADERRERTYRGISLRAARRYLDGLGGETVADADAGAEADSSAADDSGAAPDRAAVVAGDDWRASLSADTVAVGPTLQLTEVTVVFEGDPAALDDLVEAFSRKALRAGG